MEAAGFSWGKRRTYEVCVDDATVAESWQTDRSVEERANRGTIPAAKRSPDAHASRSHHALARNRRAARRRCLRGSNDDNCEAAISKGEKCGVTVSPDDCDSSGCSASCINEASCSEITA